MLLDTPKNMRMARLEDAADRVVRALVRRKDVNVVVGAMPAYDPVTKTLTVPSYRNEPEDPELCDAFRGLIDHECAHVEFTDFDVWLAALERWEKDLGKDVRARLKSLANSLEDCWIEPEFARLYPGCGHHFRRKNEYLHRTTGGNAITDPEFVPPSAAGSDDDELARIAKALSKQFGQEVKVRPPEPVGVWGAFTQAVTRIGRGMMHLDDVHPTTRKLIDLCREPLDRGWAATSTAQVVQATDDVWAILKSEVPEDEDLEDVETIVIAQIVGAGATEPQPPQPVVAQAIGGAWGEVTADADVVATAYLGKVKGEYTVHPSVLGTDRVITYGADERRRAEPLRRMLESVAGPTGAKLRTYLRAAVQASRMELAIPAQEDGDDLDPGAFSDIALGLETRRVFEKKTRAVSETAYVCVLCDCSGSMGDSAPAIECPKCGMRSCTPQGACSKCGGAAGKRVVVTKAGYAAVTASAVHRALADLRVHHAVLGYTTTYGLPHIANPSRADGHPTWSRVSHALEHHVFVPSPGIYDRGDALPYITGRDCNVDGESVMWAARYAAKHGGSLGRVMLLVVADGLPSGADNHQLEGDNLRNSVERIARAGVEVYGLACAIPTHHWPTFQRYYPDVPAAPGRAATGAVLIPSGEGMSEAVIRRLAGLLTRGYGVHR